MKYPVTAILCAGSLLASFSGPEGQESSPNRPAANSADRLLFWSDAEEAGALTDADLDLWKSRGVGGFIWVSRHLFEFGGTQAFTGDAAADLGADHYSLQRTLRDSKIVSRAKARGMKVYFGFWLTNYWNGATPLKEWFDDAGWSGEVIPKVRGLAAAAKRLGFAGIALDQELYNDFDPKSKPTWHWDYPGRTRSEKEVRDKVKERGRQLMKALVEEFPLIEILGYADVYFPETWADVVQKEANKIENCFAGYVSVDFWDGLSSVEGYGAIRLLNAMFYKVPHLGTWESAFQYEYNSLYSMLSRRFSNWSYASSRFFESPFIWIDENIESEGPWTAARGAEHVSAQLAAFKKWGMGREIANYLYKGLKGGFDYTPYVNAMKAVSVPSVVDSEVPRLEITSPTREATYSSASNAVDLDGFAVDNLAIRVVRWRNDRGGEGTAKMTWKVKSGDYWKGCDWQMDWSIRGIRLQPGANKITIGVEDIKGLSTARTITVRAPDGR